MQRLLKNLGMWIKENLGIILIFLLALAFRSYDLANLPHGFYIEEMTNTYIGRFILLHGKDIYGNMWPLLYFDKFGDFPPVIPLYISGLGTFLWGTTVFAGRFPIALFGAINVFPLYYLSQLIFKNKKVSLFCAFLLAILPWHIVLSRTTAEGVVGLTAYTYGIYFLLKGIFEKQQKSLIFSALFLFSCYFLYPGLRIIVPLSLLPIPFFTKTHKKLLIGITVVFFLLTAYISSTPWGKARFNQTSLFSSPEVKQHIQSTNDALSAGDTSITVARIFNNKVVGYTREFATQYLSYFSPSYLFLQGGGQPRYYNVPQQGLLYLTLIPLLFLCLLPIRGKENTFAITYVIYLLVITPLSAALTVDFPPHAHRSMFMILPLLLLCGYGLYKLISFKYFSILLALSIVLLCGETTYFWHLYATNSDSNQSFLRNDGDKEFINYIISHQNQYQKIIIPGYERMGMYYLFFTNNFNPSIIGTFGKELWLDKVGKVEFVPEWCPTGYFNPQTLPANTLLVDSRDRCHVLSGYTVVDEMTRKDSTYSYRLLTPKK